MASLLLAGLIGLAAASSAKKSKAQDLPAPAVYNQQSAPVYVPQASMSRHPANLPTHTPVLANPETDPESANTIQWQPDAWNQQKNGTFLDMFHELSIDNASTIRNTNMPDGLIPQFKRKLQSTYYTEPLDPYEFNQPKREVPFEELHGSPWVADENVNGNGPMYLMDSRYAEMSSRSNAGSGAMDGYSLWDNPRAVAMKSRQEIELADAEAQYFTEHGVDGTQGWGGTKGITKRHEGYHPRDRLFPYKESYMSKNPQLYDYPGVVDSGPEGQTIGQLGRYEAPGNADVDEYYVEPLPTSSLVDKGPRIGQVILKNQYRESTNIPYAGNGGNDLNAIADAGGNRRFNPNVPPITKKQLMSETASINNSLNYQADAPVGRNPLFTYTNRRVTPTIINEIDESLSQPHRSNPFASKLTNLQYPYNTSGGKVEATLGLSNIPAYAMS